MKILKEDLKMLEEDFGFLGAAAVLLAAWALSKLDKNASKGIPGQKDKPLPNDNVILAINDMWDDKPFAKDFAKILSDEGDFEKTAADFRKVKTSDKSDLYGTHRIWKTINAPDFKPNSTAKRVVEKLLKTSSYKKIKTKYKLTNEDEQFFAKLLLFTIMRDDFTSTARAFILKTLPKDWWSSNPKITGMDLTRGEPF
jgi:hypothetical protein